MTLHRLLILLVALSATLPGCSQQAEETGPAAESIENRGSAAAADSDKWWASLPRAEWSAFEKIDAGNSWFEVYRIDEGILAIYEPGQFEEVISYLILGQDRALLFDTGLGIGDMASLVATLTDLPITVLNSHTHYDHVGGNSRFATILSRGHPYAVKRAGGLDHSQVGEYAKGDWIWKPLPEGFDPETFATNGWQVSRTIDEGEFIDLGGVSLEVVDSPGHSPDSLVLVDHQRRLMFTGDTFYLAPLYSHIPGGDLAAYTASAERLAALAPAVDYLLMAHNTPRADSSYLLALHEALQGIRNNTAQYQSIESGREYRFDGFSVLTAEPPYPDQAGATP